MLTYPASSARVCTLLVLICLLALVHFRDSRRPGCSNCPCQSGLTVKYDFGEIVCGSAVSASNFDNNAPLIALPIADEASKYVLVMSDPDAPNPAWIHWLRRDISGSSLKSGQIDGSDIG
ncbi:phosphatidylethanolamine-binding protein 4-like, partial [Saccoglossus kowalevskii]